MRTLVILAVMGMCSALPQQAYSSRPSSYGHPHPPSTYQPHYVGPLASSVPAGVDGRIEQVADTYEVSAARGAFFDAYQRQLASVGATRRYAAAAAPVYRHDPSPVYNHGPVPAYHPAPVYSHGVAPYLTVVDGQVQDTPEVAAARAQFFSLYNRQAAAAAAAPDDNAYYNH